MLKTKVVKTLLSASLMAAFAAPMAVQAQTPAAGMNTPAASALSKADQKVVMDMARANMAEIETGKIAVNKAQSPEVKAYAQRMIDDHTKALTDVTNLAQTKGVTLPTEIDAKHKAMAAKLNKMEGEAFDREYMKQAGVGDHTKVHAMLKKESARVKDPDVKALASKMMPTIEEHLTQAKGMPMAKKGGMAGTTGNTGTATGGANDTARGTSGTSGTTGSSGTSGSSGSGTSGSSGTSGATGSSATTPPRQGNDQTSASAVSTSPTAKDTKPQPAPAIKQ